MCGYGFGGDIGDLIGFDVFGFKVVFSSGIFGFLYYFFYLCFGSDFFLVYGIVGLGSVLWFREFRNWDDWCIVGEFDCLLFYYLGIFRVIDLLRIVLWLIGVFD